MKHTTRNMAYNVRNNKKLLQEKKFKACFLLVSLWLNCYFVATNSRLSTLYGYDYMVWKNTFIILVTDITDFFAAEMECETRFSGRLLMTQSKEKGQVVVDWLSTLNYCK